MDEMDTMGTQTWNLKFDLKSKLKGSVRKKMKGGIGLMR